MANPDGELTVAQRLGRALDRGLFPAGGPAEAAERLIERLERPARVALLGLPGSGKSSILNLLVGAIVVPETLRLPTIIVQHGDVARMVCTLTDGTTRIVPGVELAGVLPLAPALVTLEMDLPALRVISLLEVSAGPMEAEQKRAATWASKRADIVIWCTTSYLPKEQAVWESLPDAVKDNSFMFLTKVDLLGNRDSAQAMHDRVELRAGEEFRQILSISAKQARAAMPPGGPVNRELFRDSGASAVITAIKTRVQSGRRADMDTAELLLARHVEASELVAKRFAEAEEGESPKAWTPPPESEAAPDLAAPEPVEPEPVEPEPEAPPEPAAADPEPLVAELVAAEAEPDGAAAAPEPDLAAAPEPASVAEPAPEPEREPEAQPVAAPEPEAELGTRRRFADRIKRAAPDADPVAPLVPLRTTWKSKAETEAPPPAAAPEVPRDAGRRPRASAAPAVEEPVEPESVAEPSAEMLVDAAPDEIAPAVTEAPPVEPEPAEPVLRERPLRDRPGRAVTPRPEPAAEAPRVARPQLFGGRRGPARDVPLPDLSSLRATPEEMEAALQEGAQPAEEDISPDPGVAADLADSAPEPRLRPEEPAAERPRSFDRAPRVRAAEQAPVLSPQPEASPVSRPPRAVVSAAPARPAAPAPSPVAEQAEDPFSPRSIMRRESRLTDESPPPRRERPRIAARAVPAAPAPAEVAPASAVEHTLVREALGLIATRAADLASEVDPEGKVPVDLILDHARETGEQIQSVVSRGRSDALRRINSDVGEVMDLIMLMQLEKGHAPADDALTLILQLKRELETLGAV